MSYTKRQLRNRNVAPHAGGRCRWCKGAKSVKS